jgi:hypothetical protein
MFARDIGMLEPATGHEIDDDGQGLPGRIKVNALHVPGFFNPQRSFKQFVLHERTLSRIDPFLTSLPTQNSKEAKNDLIMNVKAARAAWFSDSVSVRFSLKCEP